LKWAPPAADRKTGTAMWSDQLRESMRTSRHAKAFAIAC
jgi:hypothetical protein